MMPYDAIALRTCRLEDLLARGFIEQLMHLFEIG
jgi:hypothetical protein